MLEAAPKKKKKRNQNQNPQARTHQIQNLFAQYLQYFTVCKEKDGGKNMKTAKPNEHFLPFYQP